ncbi:MAG: hypothetical protein M3021_09245, partial [Actinomycetota bacterium]|nr:hypothetical protein [Actinomycetota bacterium]
PVPRHHRGQPRQRGAQWRQPGVVARPSRGGRAQRRLAVAIALLFVAAALGGAGVQAGPQAGIDVSNKPIQFQALRQDPINGQRTPLSVPLDQLPAPARDLLNTPVGTGLNGFWSSSAVPFLCKLAQDTLNGQGGSGVNLYGTTCGFAPAGRVTATAQDGRVVVSFFLPENVIKVWVTTPGTCADGHGTIFCPTDPHLSLTADVELQATIETPGAACDAHIDPFAGHVSNVKLDSQNFTADIGLDAASLWASLTGTDYVTTLENYIESAADQMNNNAVQMQQAITTKVAALTSGLCNTIIPLLPGANNDVWLLNGSVDPNQGIVFQLVDQPPSPSFLQAQLTPAQPSVTAGNTVKLDGQYFPSNGGTVTLTLGSGTSLGTARLSAQGSFSATVTIPAATAAGSYTIHAVAGSARADADIQVTAKGASPALTVTSGGRVYTRIGTDYPFTLSGVNFAPGAVTIYLDSPTGPRLGAITVRPDGTFDLDLKVSSAQISNQSGQHKLVAVQDGTVRADPAYSFELPEVIH